MLSLSPPKDENIQTNNNNELTFTQPLKEWIDLLWTYFKDENPVISIKLDNGLVVDRALGERIKAADPNETIVHVELPLDRLKVAHIYEIKHWLKATERKYKQDKRSEFERRDKDWKQDCISKISDKISEHFLGSMLDKEQRDEMARKIVREGNLVIAEQFGVSQLEYSEPK